MKSESGIHRHSIVHMTDIASCIGYSLWKHSNHSYETQVTQYVFEKSCRIWVLLLKTWSFTQYPDIFSSESGDFSREYLVMFISLELRQHYVNFQISERKSSGGVLWKRCSEKFCKIHRKISPAESFFHKLTSNRLAI